MNKDYQKNKQEFTNMFMLFLRKTITEWNKQSKSKISMSQSLILAMLDKHGSKTMTEIAEYLDITLSGVTSLTDKLIKEKYIIKKRSIKDKRIIQVTLTEKGQRFIEELKVTRKEQMDKLFFGLTDEEFDTLTLVYKKMLNNLNSK